MRRRAIVVIATLALATTTAALASVGGVVASASGGYKFSGSAAGSLFEVGPFTWNVQLHADGSVRGSFDYTQVRDGVELTVGGSLTCANIQGTHVWAGGIIEESSRPSLVGLEMWFQARDNGEGAVDAPDMSSTVGASAVPGSAQAYCDDAPAVLFPFLVEEGNLQVRG